MLPFGAKGSFPSSLADYSNRHARRPRFLILRRTNLAGYPHRFRLGQKDSGDSRPTAEQPPSLRNVGPRPKSILARAVRCGDYEAAALTNLAPAQVAPSPANSKLRTLPTDAVASRR
jgi:hypothetical protein